MYKKFAIVGQRNNQFETFLSHSSETYPFSRDRDSLNFEAMVSSGTNGTTSAAANEAGDAFDIGYKLQHRLSEAQAEKERTQVIFVLTSTPFYLIF